MSKTLLIVIIVASVVLAALIVFTAIKLSKSRKKKKTMAAELAKRIEKIKKENSKQPKQEPPQYEFSLEEKKPAIEPELENAKKHGKVTPIISDYVEEEDGKLSDAPVQAEEKEPVQRKSFDELMKARAERRQAMSDVQPIEEETPDDFEKFRATHSVYTSYKTDQDLVEEIQGLSPELRAIVFGNLFRRISDD